jgi:hypothetical protein
MLDYYLMKLFRATRNERKISSFADMRRFYFHVRRGQVTTMDNVGVELADYAEAVREAKKRARNLAAKEVASGRAGAQGTIIIDDQFQRCLEIPF